ncbi:MAG: hypothetical protein HGA33_00885 [Candidatus Moranbacteria bacterium]|nr:hypothetical protein [Candidatus Moranbacteria bacterium]
MGSRGWSNGRHAYRGKNNSRSQRFVSKLGKQEPIDFEALDEELRDDALKRPRSVDEVRWCPECNGS